MGYWDFLFLANLSFHNEMDSPFSNYLDLIFLVCGLVTFVLIPVSFKFFFFSFVYFVLLFSLLSRCVCALWVFYVSFLDITCFSKIISFFLKEADLYFSVKDYFFVFLEDLLGLIKLFNFLNSLFIFYCLFSVGLRLFLDFFTHFNPPAEADLLINV